MYKYKYQSDGNPGSGTITEVTRLELNQFSFG